MGYWAYGEVVEVVGTWWADTRTHENEIKLFCCCSLFDFFVFRFLLLVVFVFLSMHCTGTGTLYAVVGRRRYVWNSADEIIYGLRFFLLSYTDFGERARPLFIFSNFPKGRTRYHSMISLPHPLHPSLSSVTLHTEDQCARKFYAMRVWGSDFYRILWYIAIAFPA